MHLHIDAHSLQRVITLFIDAYYSILILAREMYGLKRNLNLTQVFCASYKSK
jgi:hypothetical protein